MSKYKRPFSINYRKPVVLDSSDPRYKNLERYRSRLGRKVIVRDLPTEQFNIQEEQNIKDFWFSSFANADLTGRNISLVNKRNSAIVLSITEDTYTKGIISEYSKSKDFISSKTFDLASSSISVSPAGMIKGFGNDLFSFGNLSTATQSGYFALHSINGSSTNFSKRIYDSSPYPLNVISATKDSSGNYYIAGTHTDISFNTELRPTTECGYIAKISSDGSTILWQNVIKETSFRAREVSVFGVHFYDEKIYVLCGLNYPLTSRRRIYAMVFDATTGTTISRNILNGFDYTEFAHSSAMDSNGNIYITERVGGSFNPCLYKFNSSLSGIWSKQMSRSTNLQGTRVYVDNDLNIYMIAEQFAVTSTDSPHLYKFDSAGNNIYNRRFSVSGSLIDRLRFENGMIFDGDGHLYIGGYFGYSSTSRIPILAHLPKDGSLTGTYSYTVALTSKIPSITYSEISPTVSSGTPSFSTTDFLIALPDNLVLDTISFNISSPSYTESGVFLS